MSPFYPRLARAQTSARGNHFHALVSKYAIFQLAIELYLAVEYNKILQNQNIFSDNYILSIQQNHQ